MRARDLRLRGTVRATVTKRYQLVAGMCHMYIGAHGDLLCTLQVKCIFYHPKVVAKWCTALLSKDRFAEQKHNYV